MNTASASCATCGWRGAPGGAFCPSCGAELQNTTAHPTPVPAAEPSNVGGRIALLALAGALLIIFLTLFVVGIALGNHEAAADPSATLAPEFPSATALLTLAPQTPAPESTTTPRETPGGGGGKGKPTKTPSPTVTNTPIPPTPTKSPTPTPTICFGCG